MQSIARSVITRPNAKTRLFIDRRAFCDTPTSISGYGGGGGGGSRNRGGFTGFEPPPSSSSSSRGIGSHDASSGGRVTGDGGGGARLRYIPSKMREEMISLHNEDAIRWNASTLSQRFGAQRNNVSAVLQLSRKRSRRALEVASLTEDDVRQRVESDRDEGVSLWQSLDMGGLSGGGGARAPYSTRRRGLPSAATETMDVKALRAEVARGGGDNENNHSITNRRSDKGEHSTGAMVDSDELLQGDVEDEEERSAWSIELDSMYATADVDAVRKSSFAFIEVGRRRDVHRAVWIRDGQTGKLRVADEDERSLLSGQVKVRDSVAFGGVPGSLVFTSAEDEHSTEEGKGKSSAATP